MTEKIDKTNGKEIKASDVWARVVKASRYKYQGYFRYRGDGMCESCRYFHAIRLVSHNADEYWSPALAQCRVNPPAFSEDEEGRWPRVKDSDWCGRYEKTSKVEPDPEQSYDDLIRAYEADGFTVVYDLDDAD